MTVIVTKNSSTASAVPTTSDLVQGELAVNVTDKRIFTENASTQIVELGTNPSTVTTTTATVSGTLTANGTFASSNAVVTGGSINSTPIGAATPSTVRGSTVTATTGFVGGLTGNVVGNVTGNVTGNVVGNVTGDLTGNVTASSGTSTVNNLVVNGTVDFSNTRLTDVAEPIAGSDAATKTYVDTSIAAVIDGAPAALDTLNELAAALNDDASFHTTVTNALTGKLALSGGTMTGQLSLGANKIVSVADPTLAQDVATKAYVDAADTTGLPLSGGTMSGAIAMGTNKITGLGTPTSAADATTKAYTDSILGSATSAADSAAAAATSASNASTSASNAASSATAASGSETAAALSATNAAASYDSFDDRYLGAKASDPATDNDGDALIAGATYFNTTSDSMKVYSGSAWSDVAPVATSVTLSQVTDFPSQSGQSGKYLSTNGTVPNWATLTTDPTLGSLTKTFTSGETASVSLTSNVLVPVVSVTKEVPQSGATNNSWDVNSTSQNYTRLNSAPATTLDWGVDLANASYVSGFNIGSQETVAQGLAFSSDGTKMYIVGLGVDTVFQYSLSTAFDVSTASYNSVSFSVASQETTPLGLDFSADGTKMYVVGYTNSIVYQYSLSTAWDLSTASYSSISFDLNSQETQAVFVSITSNGTKMYIRGFDNGNVFYQYSLSTAYDVSTASYDSISFNPSANATDPKSLSFSTNGTLLYIMGGGSDAVYQYSLSTAFNISTATYDSISFSIASQDNQPSDLAVIGSKLYFIGGQNTSVYQYSLPAGNLALGTGSFASADVGKTIEANSGVFVLTATNGSYVQTTAPTSFNQVASGSWGMFGVVYNTTDGDLELSGVTGDGFNLAAASYDSVSFSVTSQDTSPSGLAFNTDGTKMFVVGDANDSVYEYSLTTGFNPSTATYTQSFSISAADTYAQGLAFNTDGTKMFVVGQTGRDVNEYALTTGFDISTASYTERFEVSGQDTEPTGIAFSTDGTKMFVLGNVGNDVNEYTLSTGFNIATASYTRVFSLSAQDTQPFGITFNADGTSMFITGGSGNDVNEYTLSTGFNVSTASYTRVFSVAAQDSSPKGIAFNANGTKMLVLCSNNDFVFQYTTALIYNTTGYQAAHTTASTDTTYWTDINSMTANQAAGSGNVNYCISTDDRTTWTVIKNVGGERDIVRNNGGTWQYNSNATYASETWVNGSTNTELATIAQAMGSDGVGDIGNATYSSINYSTGSYQQRGVFFSADGTKMFLGRGSTNDQIVRYTLSTAWDITTASLDSGQTLSHGSQDNDATSFTLSADGTRLYVLGYTSKSVYQYIMTTAYDLTTASYNSVSLSVNSQDSAPFGMTFNNDGTKLYVGGQTNDRIFAYTLTTGFDLSTASYSSVSLSVSAQDGAIKGMLFNNAGTKLFMVGTLTDRCYQYSLTSAFDISTASYDSSSFSFLAQDNSLQGIAFKSDDTELFMIGDVSDKVYKYSMISFIAITANQMDKTQLDAVTDPNHIALSNDFDLSILLNMTSGTTVPSSNGVSINYDASILNQGAVLGTDYSFDAPTQNSVRITALAANNLKVRVV